MSDVRDQVVALGASMFARRLTFGRTGNISVRDGDRIELDIRPNMMVNARYQFLILYTVGDEALRHAREDLTAAARMKQSSAPPSIATL